MCEMETEATAYHDLRFGVSDMDDVVIRLKVVCPIGLQEPSSYGLIGESQQPVFHSIGNTVDEW